MTEAGRLTMVNAWKLGKKIYLCKIALQTGGYFIILVLTEGNGPLTARGSTAGFGRNWGQEGNVQARAWAKKQVSGEEGYSVTVIIQALFPSWAFVLVMLLLPMAKWVSELRSGSNFFNCSNKFWSLLTWFTFEPVTQSWEAALLIKNSLSEFPDPVPKPQRKLFKLFFFWNSCHKKFRQHMDCLFM